MVTMNKEKNLPISETLRIGILLAFVGGFLDAYTYTLRGGVFANAQTGNIVLLGMQITSGNFLKAFYYLFPILAFMSGVLVVACLKTFVVHYDLIHWQILAVSFKIVILFLVGWMPLSVPDALVNITISFVCSMQVCSFRMLDGTAYATTMCTGNLRSGTENLFLWLVRKDQNARKKCGQYYMIIFCFCMGAGLGAVLSKHFGVPVIWLCCGFLAIVLGAVFYEEKKGVYRED